MKQPKKKAGRQAKPTPKLSEKTLPSKGEMLRPKNVSRPFNNVERQFIKTHIARLYLEGYSQNAMSKWISENTEMYVSPMSISTYTKQVLQEWHDARVNDIDLRITAELMRLDRVEQEAWAAWERSKFDKVKYTKKNNDFYGAEDITETTESVGDVKFLELARQCILDRMQWLAKGSFAPDDAAIYNIQNNTVFIGVVDRKRPQDASNAIEAQIIDGNDGLQE